METCMDDFVIKQLHSHKRYTTIDPSFSLTHRPVVNIMSIVQLVFADFDKFSGIFYFYKINVIIYFS
jgi:hypothetical protein